MCLNFFQKGKEMCLIANLKWTKQTTKREILEMRPQKKLVMNQINHMKTAEQTQQVIRIPIPSVLQKLYVQLRAIPWQIHYWNRATTHHMQKYPDLHLYPPKWVKSMREPTVWTILARSINHVEAARLVRPPNHFLFPVPQRTSRKIKK